MFEILNISTYFKGYLFEMVDEKNINEEISLRISKRIKKLEINPSQLALRAGVSKSTIAKYLSLKENDLPSYDHIMKICKVLKVSAEWLYYGPQDHEIIHNQLNNQLDHYISIAKSCLEISQKRHVLQSIRMVVELGSLNSKMKDINQGFEGNYPSNLDISI